MKEFNNKISEKRITPDSTDSDDEYTILNTSTMQDELNYTNHYHYQIQTDYEAPYYAELLTHWKIGSVPLNNHGSTQINYKLKSFMDKTTLSAYKDAGVTTFIVENISIQETPIFFRDNSFGTVVIKAKQDTYFESELMKISDDYSNSINADVTGIPKEIKLDDIDAALNETIITYSYSWYGAVLSSHIQEGTVIRNTALVTLNLMPIIGASQ